MNDVRIKRIARTALAATALLLVGQIGLGADSSGKRHAFAEKPAASFSGDNTELKSPFVKPAWTVKVDPLDKFKTNPNRAVTGEGKVFTFNGEKLIAVNVQTGKTIWSYGAKLQPLVTYEDGVVFGAEGDGAIYAISASTGKRLWQSSVKINNPSTIQVVGETTYVLNHNETHGIHTKTGKKLWTHNEPDSHIGSDSIIESGNVVLRSYLIHGIFSSPSQLDAFDKKTGKELWKKFSQGAPIKIEGGLVYSMQDIYNGEVPERKVYVNVFNLKTGVLKGSRIYRWSLEEGPQTAYQFGGPAYLDGNDFYIHQNGILAKYDFNAYKPNGKPAAALIDLAADRDYTPLSKVHRGRILYHNHKYDSLAAIKNKANSGYIFHWNGDNFTAQTDIYGKGVYLAQTDGILHAFDFDSNRPLFRVKTETRSYGQTLKEGGSLIIQADGKLIGVQLPPALME